MRAAWSLAVAVMVVFALVLGVSAEEKKDEGGKKVTLTGKVTCNKCDLKKADECETVLVVKKGKKEMVFFFDKDSHKKYHAGICKKGKVGTVTGTVSKDEDRMVIAVTDIKYKGED